MKKQIVTAISALILSGVGAVNAAEQSSNLVVYTSVDVTCVFSVDHISFGLYSGNELTANGAVNVTCTNGTVYRIAFDAGQNYSVGLRHLLDEDSGTVPYHLLGDIGGTGGGFDDELGDAGYGESYPAGFPIGPITATGIEDVHVIQGLITAGHFGPAGEYQDIVGITLHF